MTPVQALAAAEHAAGARTRQDGAVVHDCADAWPSDHTVEQHMSDAEDTLKHLPDGWELVEHVHVWQLGPTYATMPPMRSRYCRCGARQVERPAYWCDET